MRAKTLAVIAALPLAGCGGPQSVLSPAGAEAADQIESSRDKNRNRIVVDIRYQQIEAVRRNVGVMRVAVERLAGAQPFGRVPIGGQDRRHNAEHERQGA